jgi:hypothetical protein
MYPPKVTLTAGELDVMRKCFDNRRWPRTEVTVTRAGLRSIDAKLYELSVVTRWPGTKQFDHEAAYQKELLERVREKVVSALG